MNDSILEWIISVTNVTSNEVKNELVNLPPSYIFNENGIYMQLVPGLLINSLTCIYISNKWSVVPGQIHNNRRKKEGNFIKIMNSLEGDQPMSHLAIT